MKVAGTGPRGGVVKYPSVSRPVFPTRPDGRQSCKCCGTIDGIDFHVPDDVWVRIAGPRFRDHVLCLSCFDRLAEVHGTPYNDKLRVWGHQSWQARA